MKIAQVSPLYESVPPKFYGGTERIVSYLTEELVKQGHDVTLFATGDSVTSARLISPWCCALRLQEDCKDQLVHHFKMMEMVMRESSEFDIIHYHIDYLHYSLSRRMETPHITTLHGRLDIPDLVPLYQEFNDIPVVSISDSHRKPLPGNNWISTVYHGLPGDLYKLKEKTGDYLAFIGRFSPEKGPVRAIELAIKAGIPIKMAAKIEIKDIEYYEQVVKPYLKHPLVEYVGEIGENEKNEFLGNAIGLMFLIDWPEPFGLVMIESMACGTPVIGWRNGSVPEIIDHGTSGFIVSSMEEAEKAVENIQNISRKDVRAVFERRFSAERMTEDYLRVYKSVIDEKLNSGRRLFVGNY
jgi:glycosyltransferase involved in cell wall biosynthesis